MPPAFPLFVQFWGQRRSEQFFQYFSVRPRRTNTISFLVLRTAMHCEVQYQNLVSDVPNAGWQLYIRIWHMNGRFAAPADLRCLVCSLCFQLERNLKMLNTVTDMPIAFVPPSWGRAAYHLRITL